MLKMAEEHTLEVNPEELSDKVLKELINESNIDREEAEKFADEAQLDEMDFVEPDKKNIFESIKDNITFGFGMLSSLYKWFCNRTARPKIVNVTPKGDNKVVLNVHHPKINKCELSFEKDDVEIANLMEYHNVNNPKNLEGKRILIEDISDLNFDKRHSDTRGVYSYNNTNPCHLFLIPNNTSMLGKLRYRLFSSVQDFRSKTARWSSDDKDIFVEASILIPSYVALLFITVFSGVAFQSQVGDIAFLPFGIIIMLGIILTLWTISRPILLAIAMILKGDFHKVNAITR